MNKFVNIFLWICIPGYFIFFYNKGNREDALFVGEIDTYTLKQKIKSDDKYSVVFFGAKFCSRSLITKEIFLSLDEQISTSLNESTEFSIYFNTKGVYLSALDICQFPTIFAFKKNEFWRFEGKNISEKSLRKWLRNLIDGKETGKQMPDEQFIIENYGREEVKVGFFGTIWGYFYAFWSTIFTMFLLCIMGCGLLLLGPQGSRTFKLQTHALNLDNL